MSSITKRTKKLSAQRDQYINPMTGKPYSRVWSGLHSYQTAAELRADKVHAKNYARLDREYDKQARKTCKPEYEGASVWWVPRKTPDRSIMRRQRLSQ